MFRLGNNSYRSGVSFLHSIFVRDQPHDTEGVNGVD